MKKDRLLRAYLTGVEHPEVSGFEVLELLDVRSKIVELEDELSGVESRRLEEADSKFLENGKRFYESVNEITELSEARKRENVSPSHWWWYLEKLVQQEEVAG